MSSSLDLLDNSVENADDVNITEVDRNSRNPCNPSPCYPFVTCKTIGSVYKCGKCPLGLEGDGVKCADIDEVRLIIGRYFPIFVGG